MLNTMKPMNITAIESFRLPEYNEIPDIGLFLDQTTKYLNGFLVPIKDSALTGSMISNYVKKKIISNPVKKLYYRDQIASLFFIAIVKTVLSLDDIQLLLQLKENLYNTETAYTYFKNEFQDILWDVYGMKEKAVQVTEKNVELKEILRNTIITAAHKAYLADCFETLRNIEK